MLTETRGVRVIENQCCQSQAR